MVDGAVDALLIFSHELVVGVHVAGLRRIRHEVVREDSPAVRGMLAHVGYLVEVVEG